MNKNYYLYHMNVDSISYNIVLYNKDIDYISKIIFEKKIPYEIVMLRHIVKNINREGIFVDIGANIGNHSMYVAAQTGCDIVAFEPNTLLYGAFMESISNNNFTSSIDLNCFALGSKAGKGEYVKEIPDNTGAQSIATGDGEIEISTLDNFTINKKISAIKIDVEGMELEVLQGAIETIKNNKPMLYIECADMNNFNSVFSFLVNFKYFYVNTFNATPTHFFVHYDDLHMVYYEINSTLSNYIYNLPDRIKTLNKDINNANKRITDLEKQIDNISKDKEKISAKNCELNSTVDIIINENSLLTKKIAEQEVHISEILLKNTNIIS